MKTLHYTFEGLNKYIEKETRNGNGPISGFSCMAIDFKRAPIDVILASSKIYMYGDIGEGMLIAPNGFSEFSKLVSEGLVNIWGLTSRQKMLFVSFFNDCTREGEVIKKAADAEEYLLKLQSYLPYAVKVLDAQKQYDQKLVKEAKLIANQFVYWSRRVINYRDYLKYSRFEYEGRR